MTSGPAVSNVRDQSGIEYAIDPQLHDPRDNDSAERTTANMQARLALDQTENMPAPPSELGENFLPGNLNGDASLQPKKRGDRNRKTADAPAAQPLDNEHGESQEPDRLVDDDYAPAAEPEGHDEAPAATSKKRKRATNGDSKAPKRAKKVAKRTDGGGSRSPSLAPAEESALPVSGTFTKPELETLDRFMDRYMQDNKLDKSQLAALIHSKAKGNEETTNNFWDMVFDLLPQRKDRRSVRLTCRRRYHNYQSRGQWSAEDDEVLRQAYERAPNKWSTIGQEIGRMPEDCKDRYQNYVGCGDKRQTGDWTEREEFLLADAVESCKQELRQMKLDEATAEKKPFEEVDDWAALISFKTVSAKMDYARSGLQCRQHWKRMAARDARLAYETQNPSKKKKTWRDAQAVDNWNRMLPGDKYAILQQVLDTNTISEYNIPWKLITASHPESKWTTKDRKTAFEKMKGLVEPQATLSDTLHELIRYFEEHHREELDHAYTGLVRSEETVSRTPKKSEAIVDPNLADGSENETVPKPVKKLPKAKGKAKGKAKAKATQHKSNDLITASDDEPDPAVPEETIEHGDDVEERIQDQLPAFEPPHGARELPESSAPLPEAREAEPTPAPAGIHGKMARGKANGKKAATSDADAAVEAAPKRARGRPKKVPARNATTRDRGAEDDALLESAPVVPNMLPAPAPQEQEPRVVEDSD